MEDLGEECATYLAKQRAYGGAGAMLGAAMTMYSQACTWRDAVGVDVSVDRALAILCCDLGAWAGLAAYGASHHSADAYLREALARAHVLRHAEIETRILDLWAMSCGSRSRPAEAPNAALRGVESAPFPKAQAKLHLQAARRCAVLMDADGFEHHAHLAQEPLAAGPATSARWLEAMTTGLYWIGCGHLALGQTDAAGAAFEAIAADTRNNQRVDIIHAQINAARARAEAGMSQPQLRWVSQRFPRQMLVKRKLVMSACRRIPEAVSLVLAISGKATAIIVELSGAGAAESMAAPNERRILSVSRPQPEAAGRPGSRTPGRLAAAPLQAPF